MGSRAHLRLRHEVLEQTAAIASTAVAGLDQATAVGLVRQAVGNSPYALGQLHQHLAAHPDALSSGSSDVPQVIFRFTTALVDAGHSDVVIPGCASCGKKTPSLARIGPRGGSGPRYCGNCAEQARCTRCSQCGRVNRIAARTPDGVICKTCYRRYKTEACGNCGRDRQVTVRTADGTALCPACSKRPPAACADCGEIGRWPARRGGLPRVCDGCYRQRKCGRCGRIRRIVKLATTTTPNLCGSCYRGPTAVCSGCGRERPCSRVRSGAPICESCTPHPQHECSRCGQSKPAHARWPMGPVCVRCYHFIIETPRPCARCRHRRPLIGRDEEGQGVCGPCAGADLTFECRDCGSSGGLYYQGRCPRCVLRRRLEPVFRGPDGQISAQLQPLFEAMLEVDRPRAVLDWIRKRKGSAILADLVSRDEPITHQLLDDLPINQAVDFLRAALIRTGVLPERDDRLERLEPWLETLLEGRAQHHVRVVRPYARWDVIPRARRRARGRPITPGASRHLRTTIKVALDFLTWLDEHSIPLSDLTQGHLDLWLTSGTKRRYDLRRFIHWAAQRRLVDADLCVPSLGNTYNLDAIDDEERWDQLRRCLHDTTIPLTVRVAGAIVLLFGTSPSRLVRLTAEHIQERGDQHYLMIDRAPVVLPPALAELVLELRDHATSRSPLGRVLTDTKWLFPAAKAGANLHPGTLTTRLNEHEIFVRRARTAALIHLASELPPPVLADLLGIHVSTALVWTQLVKRDWTAYVASRRSSKEAPAHG